jgi:uncharacterized membrane protein
VQVVLAIAVFGLSFSGYLSYQEIFAASRAASCPSLGRPGTVLGHPACVYGFFMYLAIVTVAALGLYRKNAGPRLHVPGLIRLP